MLKCYFTNVELFSTSVSIWNKTYLCATTRVVWLAHTLAREAWMFRSVWLSKADVAWKQNLRNRIEFKPISWIVNLRESVYSLHRAKRCEGILGLCERWPLSVSPPRSTSDPFHPPQYHNLSYSKEQILYIYIYAFSRRFYPKRLTVHSGYNFFCQYMCSLGIEPTTFALLTQCSNHWATGTLYTHLTLLQSYICSFKTVINTHCNMTLAASPSQE